MKLYLIGSLEKRDNVVTAARALRAAGFDVFDDWLSPGPKADEWWQAYEQERGRLYVDALAGPHAECVFEFDIKHLRAADAVVLALPAGKSAHLELGWALGQGKRGYILLDGEPERWDVMYRFATGVYGHLDDLIKELKHERYFVTRGNHPRSPGSPGSIYPTIDPSYLRWG